MLQILIQFNAYVFYVTARDCYRHCNKPKNTDFFPIKVRPHPICLATPPSSWGVPRGIAASCSPRSRTPRRAFGPAVPGTAAPSCAPSRTTPPPCLGPRGNAGRVAWGGGIRGSRALNGRVVYIRSHTLCVCFLGGGEGGIGCQSAFTNPINLEHICFCDLHPSFFKRK